MYKSTILARSDNKYTDIEKFKTYELTPCIAYEMAIRNEDVIGIFKRLDIVTEMMSRDEYLYKRYISENQMSCDNNYPYTMIQKHQNYAQLIEDDYKKFIDDYINKCTELDISHLATLKEKLESELINKYLIYPTGYYRKVNGASFPYHEEILNSKKHTSESIKDGKSDGFIYEEIIKTELVYHEIYETKAQANQSIFDYIEVFYNRQRMHSTNNYLSPVEFENKMLQVVTAA